MVVKVFIIPNENFTTLIKSILLTLIACLVSDGDGPSHQRPGI